SLGLWDTVRTQRTTLDSGLIVWRIRRPGPPEVRRPTSNRVVPRERPVLCAALPSDPRSAQRCPDLRRNVAMPHTLLKLRVMVVEDEQDTVSTFYHIIM